MLNMSVQIDINSLHVYESGGIIGAICVDADGVKLPSADWTDFVFAIVHNWLREIRNILKAIQDERLSNLPKDEREAALRFGVDD